MTYDEFQTWLTDGLPETEKAAVIAAISRDSIKSKTGNLRTANEFQAIESQRQQLMAELEGNPAANQPGTRAYQKWYADNWKTIEANNLAIKKYDEKHGAGAFAKAVETGAPPAATPADGTGLSQEAARKMFQEEFGKVAPNIAGIVKGAGRLVQRHMFAGRKTEIDFDAIDKLMGEKNLNLEQAYDQWDAPEREKDLKAKTDAEVERRVKEEIQRRGATMNFPAAADATPSSLTARPDTETKGFDRSALNKDLLSTWMNPVETPTN